MTNVIIKKNNNKVSNNSINNKPQLKNIKKEITTEELIKLGEELVKRIIKEGINSIDYNSINELLDKGIYNQSKLRHQFTNYTFLIEQFNIGWSELGGLLKGKLYNKNRDRLKNTLNEYLYSYSLKYIRKKLEEQYKKNN